MPTAALSKSKRFNEIFHILLEHNFVAVLKDLAFYGRRRVEETQPEDSEEGHTVVGDVGLDGVASRQLPVRIRRLMEDLGPTFIKIGQLLGSRPDLVPPEFVEEFKKMYDQTTPTPYPEVRRMVEAELRRPIGDAFLLFEEKPIASASIAQVHRARLKDGRPAAVKVQHPGIEERMRTDFEILRGIVGFTERVFASSRVWQPVNHLEEVRQMLNKELDFRGEILTQQKVYANFKDDPSVKIPEVHTDLSTSRVLTMEFVEGIKFRSRDQPELAQIDRARLARTIAISMARQIFVHRLFHADPSPGNFLVLGSDRICFLDFGAFGQVTRRRTQHIFDLIVELRRGNPEGVGRAIVELCDTPGGYDPRAFLRDVDRILDYYEKERPSPADPVLMQKILRLAKTHNMLLPADFMLITRALYQFDGICKELDPSYELVDAIAPVVGKVARDQMFSPEAYRTAFVDTAQDVITLMRQLPRHTERILSKLERGELVTQTEVRGQAEQRAHQARLAYFASFTVLLSVLILGGAIVAASDQRGQLSAYVLVAAFALGLWLILLIMHWMRGRIRRRR